MLTCDPRWLLVGVIAVSLVKIFLLVGTIQLNPIQERTLRAGKWASLGSAVLIVLLGFTNLEILPLLVIVVLLLLTPIIAGIRSWLVALEQEPEKGSFS
jgi:hypothetical protein